MLMLIDKAPTNHLYNALSTSSALLWCFLYLLLFKTLTSDNILLALQILLTVDESILNILVTAKYVCFGGPSQAAIMSNVCFTDISVHFRSPM